MGARGGLSGAWTGAYSYPGPIPSVPFNAHLEQTGIAFSGTITEPDTLGVFKVVIALSMVEGWRDGVAVQFRKTMTNGHPGHVIFYEGVVNSDETRIEGLWRIPPRSSGSFHMVREAKAKALARERRTTVKA